MEVTPKKTIFEKFRETIPLITPLLMLAAISFTYFTYFFDINKIPQVSVQNTVTKLYETDKYYIVKISLKVKNQSKTRVEVLANLGKLYGYRVSIKDSKNDSLFIERIMDTIRRTVITNKEEPFELHRDLSYHDERLLGFYQPIHNASWMLPEQTYTNEIVAAVPKFFDIVYYYYNIDFTNDEENIFSRYKRDKNGDPEYELYTVDGNDTITLRELNIENQDSNFSKSQGFTIYASGAQYAAWLNTGGSAEGIQNNNDSVDFFPDDVIKKEE
ncbi:MAG: hypothetical protein ABIY50_04415 [Ignavibacteria bacterium]